MNIDLEVKKVSQTYENIIATSILVIISVLICFFSSKEPVYQPAYLMKKEITLSSDIEVKGSKTVVISFTGDTTLGSDENFGYTNTFHEYYDKYGKEYFLKNVKHIFEKVDYTVFNLEGPLTNEGERADKEYAYKGRPEYIEILKEASVNAVNLANNHVKDYGNQGFIDTKQYLDEANIAYFENNTRHIATIKDQTFAFLGYGIWIDSVAQRNQIKNDIEQMKKQADVVIVTIHGGDMDINYPNDLLQLTARHIIDSGADIVIGHHPHTIQSIEKYKDKYIAYSIGNFLYGGSTSAYNSDTIILNVNFIFSDNSLTDIKLDIIPASISGTKNINNYQPVILKDEAYKRVIDKINLYSKDYNFYYSN